MLRYKIDVLTALKENGYTTYKILRLRRQHWRGNAALSHI